MEDHRWGARQRPYAGVVATVAMAALVTGGSVAFAAIPDSDTGLFTGCYNTKDGDLRLIDKQAGQECLPKGEREVFWNQTGPQGPQGPQGLQGAEGPSGAQGVPGVSGFESIEQQFTVQAGGVIYSATAMCPRGKVVIGGGYKVGDDQNPAAQQVKVFTAAPYHGDSGVELFYVNATNDTASSVDLTVFATCAAAATP